MEKYDWLSIIRFNIFGFELIGLWPKNNQHQLNCYFLRGFLIILIFGFIQTTTQTVILLTNITDMHVVGGTAFLVISCQLILMKMFYVAKNVKSLKEQLSILKKDMFQLRRTEQLGIITPSINTWKLTYNLLGGSITGAIIFWTIDSFRRRRLPFLSWYPYNTTVSPLYEITCIHQIASLSFAAYANVNMDTFIAAFCLFAGAQLDILCDDVKNLQPEGFKENLSNCVKHHREIVKFVKTYNKTFDWIILVQFFSSAASLGVTMFMVVAVPAGSSDFYSFIFYSNAVIMEIFIYSWFGNELQLKSSKIFFVAFESQWIEASEEAKHDLLFFMLRTQTVLKMSALDLFDLTLENFLRILKTAYSYFALVSRFSSDKQK